MEAPAELSGGKYLETIKAVGKGIVTPVLIPISHYILCNFAGKSRMWKLSKWIRYTYFGNSVF
jgi:hypothetical protein